MILFGEILIEIFYNKIYYEIYYEIYYNKYIQVECILSLKIVRHCLYTRDTYFYFYVYKY